MVRTTTSTKASFAKALQTRSIVKLREAASLGLQCLVGVLEVCEFDKSGPTGEHEEL